MFFRCGVTNDADDADFKLFLYFFSREKLEMNVTRVTAHQEGDGGENIERPNNGLADLYCADGGWLDWSVIP